MIEDASMRERAGKIISGAVKEGWVVEPLARDVLVDYGLPVSRFAWVRTPADAMAAAEGIGFPVVMKVVSPKVMHKSDVGGVAVGLKDEASVKAAFDRMSKIAGFDGVLVDQMVKGVEMIVGAKQDSQFGTVVLAGIGGTAVEVYKDVVIRMAPLGEEAAKSALLSLKGVALLKGHRGASPANLESIAALVSKFSEAAHDLAPAIDSIDLNPVMCGPDRAVIADARMVLAAR